MCQSAKHFTDSSPTVHVFQTYTSDNNSCKHASSHQPSVNCALHPHTTGHRCVLCGSRCCTLSCTVSVARLARVCCPYKYNDCINSCHCHSYSMWLMNAYRLRSLPHYRKHCVDCHCVGDRVPGLGCVWLCSDMGCITAALSSPLSGVVVRWIGWLEWHSDSPGWFIISSLE